jgi:DNA processing protein
MMAPQDSRVLTDVERLDWLRLIRSENVGPVTFGHLLTRFGSASEALRALPDLARRGGRTGALKICSAKAAEAEMDHAAKAGARFIALPEPDYPKLLAAIDGPPPLISVIGHIHLAQKPTIAIVGARNASVAGLKLAAKIANDLSNAGVVVVSGLARGIDGAAHSAALAHGTIAVMAGGIDILYPAEHRALYDQIASQGALVSEIAMGEEPQARHFPRRNRIVSGLSLGTVVVEAAKGSGSLITARYALEQGREVFAVPGSPLDPRSAGGNGLIKDGAVMTESASDILAVLSTLGQRPAAYAPKPPALIPAPIHLSDAELDRARRLVVEKLSPTPVEIDALLRATGLAPAVVATILLELDLAGRLQRHPGQLVSLI